MEEVLIRKSVKKDKEAFSKLISIYHRRLFTYILRRCGNRDVAEDIFQETLIKIWNNIHRYKEQQKFSSWLFSIAHNLTVDYFRKNKKIFENVDEKIDLSNLESIQDKIEEQERKQLLQSALNNLTESQKEVFLLRQAGELKFSEISELTQQPLNTVLSHMNYAIKKLKKILREKSEV